MSGDPDGDDELRKQQRLQARAARFNNVLPGNRYKELDAMRSKARDAYLKQGLITSGKTKLDSAIDLRGECEGMCTEYEAHFREYTKEIHPFEATPDRRMDYTKAVAAYTRSDAGAGHGAAAILPNDLRTPQALVRSLDYLFTQILPMQPPPNPNAINPPPPTARRALGYSAGFIRDRTRAIRKEFAIQSSWGHEEAISCFERIARWHILCLRELQEETGSNSDMHIDSAELGRAFTSLRQHYNDRREESGLDMPCPNEPEFRAYMLIFDLNSKSVSIPISELPAVILDHPLVQLAWQFKQAAQRNFDSQKEGSKLNAELGLNLINRFTRLLKQPHVPFLFSCLVEIRLREMRRSAIRALTRTYPRLRQDPIRYNEAGEIIERRMLLLPTLDSILGAEEQETEGPAWDDVVPVSKNPDDESVAVVERFGINVYRDASGPVGAFINLAAPYNDNKDAPYTRRWKFITDKRADIPYADIVNGKSGVALDGRGAAAPVTPSVWKPSAVVQPPQPIVASVPQAPVTNGISNAVPPSFTGGAFKPAGTSAFGPSSSSASAFGPTATSRSAFGPGGSASAFGPKSSTTSAFAPPTSKSSASAFSSGLGSGSALTGVGTASTPAAKSAATLAPPPVTLEPPGPELMKATTPKKSEPEPSTTPKGPPPSFFPSITSKKNEAQTTESLMKRKSFFDTPPEAGPSKPQSTTPQGAPSTMPSFFGLSTTAAGTTSVQPPPPSTFSLPAPTPSKTPTPKEVSPPRPLPPPEPPRMKVDRDLMRIVPSRLRDRLIAEVVDAMVRSAEPDFMKMVRQFESAQQYEESKVRRRKELARFAQVIVNALIAEHVETITRRVYDQERHIRELVRSIALHWRSWTAKNVEYRAERQRERDANYARLKNMGLGRSVASFDRPLQLPSTPLAPNGTMSTASITSMAPSTSARQDPVDEVELILGLHETEKYKEKLWENSSFLRSLATHVAAVVRPTEDDPEPLWNTVILTAEHAGSGVGAEARAWLADKFLPSEGDSLRHRHVTFTSNVEDVHGDIPGSADTGLVIFETPLETVNSSKSALNAEDAADRLEAISGRFQQGSRYRPALLLVTWIDEPFDDLVERLRIADHLAEFDRVSVLSLEDADDLDERFEFTIRELVPSDPRMVQVALHMRDVVARLEPGWLNLLHLAQQIHRQFPNSPALAADIMTYALTPLYRLEKAIDIAVEGLPVSDQSTYDPPALPRLVIPSSSRDDAKAVTEEIAAFLSEPPLAHVSDVALVLGPLRQSAASGRPIPILRTLEAVGSYFFGSLVPQCLRLDQWMVPPHPAHASAELADKIVSSIEADLSAAAQGIAGAGREIELASAAATPLPFSPESTPKSTPKSTPILKGTKRGLDESQTPPATKAAKSARLLRILADAQATLNKIDHMDEQAALSGL